MAKLLLNWFLVSLLFSTEILWHLNKRERATDTLWLREIERERLGEKEVEWDKMIEKARYTFEET